MSLFNKSVGDGVSLPTKRFLTGTNIGILCSRFKLLHQYVYQMVHLVCDYSDSPLHISICNRDFHLSAGVPSSLLPYKQRFYSGWQRDQLKDYISYPPHAGRWDHMTKFWLTMWKWKWILSIPGRLSQGSWFSQRAKLFSALPLFLFLLPPG